MGDTYTRVPVHMTCATLNRRPLIPTPLLPRVRAYIGGVLEHLGCAPLAVGGVEDHVHVLYDLHPERTMAEVARVVKANTSKWLRGEMGVTEFAWQRGYSTFGVSPSAVDDVRRYIANQREHHRVRLARDELIEFLNRAGVEFDARYLE